MSINGYTDVVSAKTKFLDSDKNSQLTCPSEYDRDVWGDNVIACPSQEYPYSVSFKKQVDVELAPVFLQTVQGILRFFHFPTESPFGGIGLAICLVFVFVIFTLLLRKKEMDNWQSIFLVVNLICIPLWIGGALIVLVEAGSYDFTLSGIAITDHDVRGAVISAYRHGVAGAAGLTILAYFCTVLVLFVVCSFFDMIIEMRKEWIERMAQVGLSNAHDAHLTDGVFILEPDGSVVKIQLQPAVSWLPLPYVFPRLKRLRRMSLDFLFRALLGDGKQKAFSDLASKIADESIGDFSQTSATAASTVLGRSHETLSEYFRKACVSKLKKTIYDRQNNASALLQSVVEDALKRFKEEHSVAVVETATDVFRNVRDASVKYITGQVSIAGQKAREGHGAFNDGALPLGTRFDFSDQNRTVLVVEESPQTRTVRFDQSFFNQIEKNKANKETYLLAFPYVVYVILYNKRNGDVRMSIFYRNSSLTRFDDELFEVNLPNINGGSVCFGSASLQNGSLLQVTQSAIAGFWQSNFNSDYPGGYREMKDRRPTEFRSVADWEASSKANPLFVLSVDWRRLYTVKQFVSDCLYQEPEDLASEIRRAIQDAFTDAERQVNQRVRQKVNSLTVEGRYTSKTKRVLSEHITATSEAVLADVQQRLSEITFDSDGLCDQMDEQLKSAVRKIVKDRLFQLSGEVLVKRQGDFQSIADTLSEIGRDT
jgi:hypothetical protein